MKEANISNLKIGDKVVANYKVMSYLEENGVDIRAVVYGIVKRIDPEDDTAYVDFMSYKGYHLIGTWLNIPKNKSEILFYESH